MCPSSNRKKSQSNVFNHTLSFALFTIYKRDVPLTKVLCLLKATVIFEALDNILSESNQASFDSLQEIGVGSQAVLMNAESFGLFAARVLATDEDMRPGQVVNITGENMGW